MAFISFSDMFGIGITIIVSLVFVVLVIIIGILFIYTIKKQLIKIINNLENIVSSAINEESMVTGYTDNILSSFESKIHRYVKINKASKESIEKERNKIKTLVADISHQTKTPISNILLYSQLILENKNIDEHSKMMLNDIKKQSERLNFLIQSLIKMSRLESGVIELSKSNSQIYKTIYKSVQEVYLSADNKNIDIKVDIDKKISANYDSKWTREAVVNILENAIKYSKENSQIEISVKSYELFKRIDIKDNGIGIDESEINNIFKRFYRCKNAKQHEGVGIGLYLTRTIISKQGGYIKVQSEIGQGSTFSIYLPT
jgi:signal transduction histidine kinase